MKSSRSFFAVGIIFVVGFTGCSGEDCRDLANEASAMRSEMGACGANDTCVIVKGSSNDCSGGVSCPFAVHADRAAEAASRAADIAKRSQDCTECSMPSCPPAQSAYCDHETGRCVIVQ